MLQQAGDLPGAYERLEAAAELAPSDRRLGFELADVANRLGEVREARERFEATVADPETAEACVTRTADEQAGSDRQMERLRFHMQLRSDFHEHHHEQLPEAPPALVDEIKAGDRAFRNGAARADLDATVEMPDCT